MNVKDVNLDELMKIDNAGKTMRRNTEHVKYLTCAIDWRLRFDK